MIISREEYFTLIHYYTFPMVYVVSTISVRLFWRSRIPSLAPDWEVLMSPGTSSRRAVLGSAASNRHGENGWYQLKSHDRLILLSNVPSLQPAAALSRVNLLFSPCGPLLFG